MTGNHEKMARSATYGKTGHWTLFKDWGYEGIHSLRIFQDLDGAVKYAKENPPAPLNDDPWELTFTPAGEEVNFHISFNPLEGGE